MFEEYRLLPKRINQTHPIFLKKIKKLKKKTSKIIEWVYL